MLARMPTSDIDNGGLIPSTPSLYLCEGLKVVDLPTSIIIAIDRIRVFQEEDDCPQWVDEELRKIDGEVWSILEALEEDYDQSRGF